MTQRTAKSHPVFMSPLSQVFSLIGLTVLVDVLRRPNQFTQPYLWFEEGVVILPSFAARGFESFVDPIGGYYVLTTKVIMHAAFALGFEWAPAIAVWLSVGLNCLVVVAVALSPTSLRCRFLCAIALLVLPCGPEVYASAISSLFWAGVLLCLALLWNSQDTNQYLRNSYIVIGGLSSPLILPFAGLLALRASIERTSSGWTATAVAVVISLIQLTALASSDPFSRTNEFPDPVGFLNKFAGYLFVGQRYGEYFWSGPVVLIVLGALAWPIRTKLTFHFLLLLIAWATVSVAAVARWKLVMISPWDHGQRYFFLPYALLIWAFVWIAVHSSVRVRLGLLVACLIGIAASINRMSERQVALNWQEQVNACKRSVVYRMPILLQGKVHDDWYANLTGEQCRRMAERSLFRR